MTALVERAGSYDTILALPNARVPILKFVHTDTGVACDITFNRPLSMHNSALLRTYCEMDPRVRPLVLAVKRWGKARDIADSTAGTLSSYAWNNLVIFFLQQPIFDPSPEAVEGCRRGPILVPLQNPQLVERARGVAAAKLDGHRGDAPRSHALSPTQSH
jgi:DNA polymerase sigma